MSAPLPPPTPTPIRRLGRRDAPELERHLLALGPADRRKRFLSPANDAAIAGYVARIDFGRAVVVAAAAGNGRVVGVAEARPVPGAARAVEVAASVHPYHRREGLGRRLAARAVFLAFAGGAETAVFVFLPENGAAAGLVRSLGAGRPGPGRLTAPAAARRPQARGGSRSTRSPGQRRSQFFSATRRANASSRAGSAAAAGVGLTTPASRSPTPHGAATSTVPDGPSRAATAVAVSGQCAIAWAVPA